MRSFLRAITPLLLAACTGDPVRGPSAALDPGDATELSRRRLDGEWLLRHTVTAVPEGPSIVHVGLSTRAARVRFQILEQALVAYPSPERVDPGGDDVAALAAWKVVRHFGAGGRPWWEQTHLEVDWTRMIVGGAVPFPAGPDGLLRASPEASGVRDGGLDPDELARAGDGHLRVRGRLRLEPESERCRQLAEHVLAERSEDVCRPVVVEVLTSFVRLDGRPVPETLEHPDRAPLAADIDGDGVVEELGPVLSICGDESCTARALVECTPEVLRELARDPFHSRRTQHAECARIEDLHFLRFGFRRTHRPGGPPLLNRWHLWERSLDEAGRSIPHEQRTPRRIVFHLSPGFPPELVSAAQELGDSIDAALKETVAALGVPAEGPLFEIVENACSLEKATAFARSRGMDVSGVTAGNVAALCRRLEPRGFDWADPGDLRHSFLHWVHGPQDTGPAGSGPTSVDPGTGEIVSANALVFGAAVDRLAELATDVVETLRGTGALPGVTMEELRALAPVARAVPALGISAPPGTPAPSSPPPPSLLDRLREDPVLEARLVDGESLLAVGLAASSHWIDPRDPPDAAEIEAATVRNHAARQETRRRLKAELLRGDCVVLEHWLEPAVIAAALDHDPGDRSREEVREALRERIFRTVALHQLGHALGLEHNLAGSSDALNYDPRFWDVRTGLPANIESAIDVVGPEDQAALQRCRDDAAATGRPAPDTHACLRLPEHATSSVMDLLPRLRTELGRYDVAAIRYGYGQLEEMFEGLELDSPWVGAGKATEARLREVLLVESYANLPGILGGREAIDDRVLGSYAARVRDEVAGIRARSRPDALPVVDPESGICLRNCVEPPEVHRVPVPYRFCAEVPRGGDLVLSCGSWDEGADAGEVVASARAQGRVLDVLLTIPLSRPAWSERLYVDELEDLVLAPAAAAQSGYRLYGGFYERFGVGQALARGAVDGLDLAAERLFPIENGWYCQMPEGDFWHERYVGGCAGPGGGWNVLRIDGRARSYWSAPGMHAGSVLSRRAALRALATWETRSLWREPIFEILHRILGTEPWVALGTVHRGPDGELHLWGPGEPVGPLRASYHDPTLQREALVLALTAFSDPDGETPDFEPYLRVGRKGSVEHPHACDLRDPGEAERYTELWDPISQRTYCAVNTPDGRSIAHALLEQASDHLERFWAPARQAFDAAQPTDSNYFTLREALADAERQVALHVERIEYIRRFRELLLTR